VAPVDASAAPARVADALADSSVPAPHTSPARDDLPRERLQKLGVAALTENELLCLLIGAGSQGRSVWTLSRELFFRCHDLSGLAQASLAELCRVPGIGRARAGVILAALELGRRAAQARPARGQRLSESRTVGAYLRARLSHESVEEFWAIALDARHRVQSETRLARGSLTAVEVHPRDVFRPLIREGAAAVIFCHNHPSGDPTPSRQDLLLTDRLRDVGELCGITVLDHIVVGSEGYVSLADRGWR
jgi:DNA repair protein RadC